MKKPESWLWPNRTIGKKESAVLREEHNDAVQQVADMTEVLQHCKKLFDSGYDNQERLDAIKKIDAVIDGD